MQVCAPLVGLAGGSLRVELPTHLEVPPRPSSAGEDLPTPRPRLGGAGEAEVVLLCRAVGLCCTLTKLCSLLLLLLLQVAIRWWIFSKVFSLIIKVKK